MKRSGYSNPSRKNDQLDFIHITGIAVDCIAGIYPKEREMEQPLIVDLRLGLDFSQVVKTGDLNASCDYDRITNEIIALVKFRKYLLLEVAVEELAAMLIGLYENISTVNVRIDKPQALQGRAKCASVEIQRQRQDFARLCRETDFGSVETLVETNEAGLYLVHIEPGDKTPEHKYNNMRELSWVVKGEILCNGELVDASSPMIWEIEKAHYYENPGQTQATLFRSCVPAYIAADVEPSGYEDKPC